MSRLEESIKQVQKKLRQQKQQIEKLYEKAVLPVYGLKISETPTEALLQIEKINSIADWLSKKEIAFWEVFSPALDSYEKQSEAAQNFWERVKNANSKEELKLFSEDLGKLQENKSEQEKALRFIQKEVLDNYLSKDLTQGTLSS